MSLDIYNQESTNFNNFPNICRTCGIYSDDLFPIDDDYDEGVNLKCVIINWSKLEFQEDDQLPKNMCKSCIKTMYHINRFLEKCNAVKDMLNAVLEKSFYKSCTKIENKNEVNYEDMDMDIFHNFETIEIDPVEELEGNEEKNTQIANEVTKIEKKNGVNHKEMDMDIFHNFEIIEVEPVELERNEEENTQITNEVTNDDKQTATVSGESLPLVKRTLFLKGPPFKCIQCNCIFNKYNDLIKHKLETKHLKKSVKYRCPFCPKQIFADYATYMQHLHRHAKRKKVEKKKCQCSTCGKLVATKFALREHMTIHSGIKAFKCDFCAARYARKTYLQEHERKHKGEKLICSKCGKCFTLYKSLRRHEKAHNEIVDGPVECELCGKKVTSIQQLKAHKYAVHSGRTFVCEYCSKTFKRKHRLEGHILSDHKGIKFHCQLCNRAYTHSYTLKQHLKRHTDQTKHVCSYCGKQFSLKYNLTLHLKIHTGDTTHQCHVCKYICTTKQLLAIHMRVHTGERPFICEYCGKSFKQKSHASRHIQIYHSGTGDKEPDMKRIQQTKTTHVGDKSFICTTCGKGFYLRRYLLRHVRRLHPDNW